MLAALSRPHIAKAGRLGGGPALGPNIGLSSWNNRPARSRHASAHLLPLSL